MIRAALLALLAALALGGCGREDAGSTPVGRPALWVVERDGSAPVAWLFGTIHALPAGAHWNGPQLDRVIAGAGVLVVEVRDLDQSRIAETFARLAQDEPIAPLAQRISADEERALRQVLGGDRHRARALDRFETWAVALALAPQGGGMDPANGADKALLAHFAGRPVMELEGAAAQLALFDALPERDQRAMLTAVLAERRDPDAAARALAEAWLAGDLARLDQATRSGLLADPALERALASGRNAAWLAKIIPLIEAGRRPLVAVGAAHILGPRGLPALLAARGYRVRRVQ